MIEKNLSKKSAWIAVSLLLMIAMILGACAPASTPAPNTPAAEKTSAPAATTAAGGDKPFAGVTLNLLQETVPDLGYWKK